MGYTVQGHRPQQGALVFIKVQLEGTDVTDASPIALPYALS